MEITEAIEICNEYGWEVSGGKWHLECVESEDKVNFQTDKDLIDYAEELKRNR